MKLLTIDGYGYNLSVDGGRLETTNGHHYNRVKKLTKHRRKYLDFDKVVISGSHGNISISAIKWIMKQKRDIVVLDWNGKIITSMSPMIANLGQYKIAQYDAFRDDEKSLFIAKWVIEQKFRGCMKVLDWLDKNQKNFTYPKITPKLFSELDKMKTVKQITTLEAMFSQHYWKAIASFLDSKWEFISRNFGNGTISRNADDPINALLNYGYSILESECWKTVNTVGLEPYLGFVHKTYTNKAPLIYDLQEPFRWIVELGILRMIKEKSVKPSHFMTTDEGNVRLKPDAVKLVVDRIARQFSSTVLYKGKRRQWETMIMIKTRELTKIF